jgi:hypothetical protein
MDWERALGDSLLCALASCCCSCSYALCTCTAFVGLVGVNATHKLAVALVLSGMWP